jgi:hypothetical protein
VLKQGQKQGLNLYHGRFYAREQAAWAVGSEPRGKRTPDSGRSPDGGADPLMRVGGKRTEPMQVEEVAEAA